MKVSSTLQVWVSSPGTLLNLDPENGAAFCACVLLLAGDHPDMTDMGWVRIGDADIVITITRTHQELMAAGAEATALALSKHNAEAEKRRVELEGLRHKFLAIGWGG